MQANQNWRAATRPEMQLVIDCARAWLDERGLARVRGLISRDLNWDDALGLAAEHHVEPLLYRNLKLAGGAPAGEMEALQQRARKAEGLAFLYFSELVRVAALFEAEKILLIPYKGPVLAWLAYGQVTLRRFVDLDFFSEQKNISRVTALLTSAGFHANFGSVEENAGAKGYAPGQYGFTSASGPLQIEVHTERTLRYFPRALVLGEMAPRLLELRIEGHALRTFSVEDTLVMVCVHGAKHFWERLSWLADVAELARTQSVNWPLALQIAAKLSCTRPLLLGLALADELLEAPVAPEILEQARADSKVGAAVRQLRDDLLRGSTNAREGLWRRAKFRFALREANWQGIRHLARLSFAPTESDRRALRLPRALAPLYLFVRPWRLVQVYGSGLLHRATPRRNST